MSQTTSNI